MNTPFQYYKQVASHFGGVRNGLVISWPGHLSDHSTIRNQFLYVTDVAPTILEAAGVSPPQVMNGVTQMPFDGVSFAHTFQQPAAPSRRTTQVFEMVQNLGIYHDGWMAGTRPAAAPWEITQVRNIDLDSRVWELYHVAKDFSQANNLAGSDKARLQQMKNLFFAEAERYKILPIHSIGEGAEGRPSLATGRTSFVYQSGVTRVPENTAPRLIGRPYQIAASIVVPAEGAHGVLVTSGGRFGGYALYVKDSLPIFHYNMINNRQYTIRSARALPGAHEVRAHFVPDNATPGSGGNLTLMIDRAVVGTGRIEHTHKTWISNSEGFDVGEDTLTPINDDYTASGSKFSGQLSELRIDLDR